MRTTIKAMFILVLLVSASFAFARRGSGTMHIGHIHNSGRDSKLTATADQRIALSRCLEETERFRSVVHRMPRIGSPWSRGRLSYTSGDLIALSHLKEQFEAALTNLGTTHSAFRKALTVAQASDLQWHLRTLEKLQAKMSSGASELDHDLGAAKPGPASPNISWDVNSIQSAADRWRSELRKIAKEMDISS